MSNWVRIQDEFARQNGIFYSYDSESTPLGKGGMGTVFKGYCVKDDGSGKSIFVAIKRVEGDFPELLSRARQEASVQIVHPNLLRMYAYIDNLEIDPTTNQQVMKHYVIMDLLTGVDLYQVLDNNLRDREGNVVQYAEQLYDMYQTDRFKFVYMVMSDVLKGVGKLHSFGVVHRDLDPSNIMITHTEDGNYSIKVIDYGISKQIKGTNVVVSHETMVGAFIGKSGYAAPEVVVGDIENHNATTDIYALGIMLYQLYMGEMPFQGNDTEVRKMQLDTDVPVANISNAKLRRIISRATKKEQKLRYQSAEDMLKDLEAAYEDELYAQGGEKSAKESEEVKPTAPSFEGHSTTIYQEASNPIVANQTTTYSSPSTPNSDIVSGKFGGEKEINTISDIPSSTAYLILGGAAILGLVLGAVVGLIV